MQVRVHYATVYLFCDAPTDKIIFTFIANPISPVETHTGVSELQPFKKKILLAYFFSRGVQSLLGASFALL